MEVSIQREFQQVSVTQERVWTYFSLFSVLWLEHRMKINKEQDRGRASAS